ncbi:hypothetical protein [Pediococcus pentosaceus]|uniref:hypothetical protein n=1 Tax=Pediococcus pentosaceus TaxID=1255 RepID=UPI00077CCDD9|nr:hypothetical protein [Pediococcus pentosaceus]QYY85501.1 hypothetical protein GRI00_02575 [Pediococcus pentosaceus]
MKYTVKELTKLAGTHDPYHCHEENCNICIRFWTYAKGLREQDKEEEQRKVTRLVSRRKNRRQVLAKLDKIKTTDVKKLVREWRPELTQAINAGCSVRDIAFELDCDDAVVVEALDYLRLKPKTRSQLRIEAYRDELTRLVAEGYSVEGIAKLLNKKAPSGISYYLSKYELPRPNAKTIKIEQTEYRSGREIKHRYFDKQGNEIEIKYVNS